MAIREGFAVWEGSIKEGKGSVCLESGAFEGHTAGARGLRRALGKPGGTDRGGQVYAKPGRARTK